MTDSPHRALLRHAVSRGVISETRLGGDEDSGSVLRRMIEEGTLTEAQLIDLAHEAHIEVSDAFLARVRPLLEPPAPPLSPGVPFGRKYEVVEVIGRGGMGVVYKARDRELGRDVAIKFLQVGEADDLARFQREAQLVAQLSHPSIAAVYELGMHDGRPFLAMQAVNGSTLDEAEALPLRDVCTAIRDAARAVQFAHDHRIIHRDLKPGNIMIEGAGPTLRTFVLDFGLARTVGHGTTISVTGDIIGTPAFMSPEQAAGETERVGPLSDVYALGATLYSAAAGHAPFVADNPARVLLQVLDAEPTPPRRLNPLIHVDVETVILKAMDKRPERRYASAGALADDLDRFLRGEPIEARRLSWAARAARRLRRNLPLAIAVAALVVGSIAGASALVSQRLSDAREREGMAVRQQEAQRRRQNAMTHVQSAARLIEQLHDYKNRYGLSDWKIALYEPRVAEALDLAIAEDAGTPEIYAWRGMWFYVVGRPDEAAAELDRAVALDPESLAALYLRGRCAMLRIVDSGMMPVSRTTGSGVELGAMKLPEGRWRAQVEEDFARIAAIVARRGGRGLNAVERATVEAMLLFLDDRAAEARAALDVLIDEWPWVMELYLYRSYVNTILGEYAAAVADLDALSLVWFNNGTVYYFRAQFRLNAIREAEARGPVGTEEYLRVINDFERARQLLDPVPGAVLAGRAVAYLRMGAAAVREGRDPWHDYMAARRDFDRALEVDPNDYIALNNRAGLHKTLAEYAIARDGDPTEEFQAGLEDAGTAIAVMEAILRHAGSDRHDLVRNFALLYGTRAALHKAVGDERRRRTGDPEPYYGHALADFEDAIARYPGYAVFHHNRAVLWFEYSDHPDVDAAEMLGRALTDCNAAIAADPAFRRVLGLRARVLRHLALATADGERMEEALEAFAAVPDQIAEIPDLGVEYANALIDRAEQPGGDAALLRRAIDVVTDVLQRIRSADAYDARATAGWRLYLAERGLDDLRLAERDYAAEAELLPQEARVWANLSEMRYHLGEWDGALAAIDRALALEPSDRYRGWREKIERAKREGEF